MRTDIGFGAISASEYIAAMVKRYERYQEYREQGKKFHYDELVQVCLDEMEEQNED